MAENSLWDWVLHLSTWGRLWEVPWWHVPANVLQLCRKCWLLWFGGRWSCVNWRHVIFFVQCHRQWSLTIGQICILSFQLHTKISKLSWSDYCSFACPLDDFLNVITNEDFPLLSFSIHILHLSDLNVSTAIFFLAVKVRLHAKKKCQKSLTIHSMTETATLEWRNMPHILITKHFGMETVIITERTVKWCSCSRVKKSLPTAHVFRI